MQQLEIDTENFTKDMEVLAANLHRLSFHSNEVLQLNPLLNCGFKPTDIVSVLKTYELGKDSEHTKGVQEVSNLEQLIQLGFTPSFVIKGINEKKNVNEILQLWPSLISLYLLLLCQYWAFVFSLGFYHYFTRTLCLSIYFVI